MNTKLILLAVSVAAFSSCTTLYKSGQTPDDVYFSPTRPSGGYGEEKQQPRDEVQGYDNEYRTVRMGINDRRWRYLDYNYSNNPYINDYSYTPYNYGYNFGYYYNPYFWPYPVYNNVYITPSVPKNTTPRMANLSGYNAIYNNSPVGTKTGGMRPVRSYNNNNRGSAVGNVIRQVFTPSTNSRSSTINNNNLNNNNSSSNNTRTYTPSTSSSSSSSGSSSSGSGGGVSRPPRN